MSLAKALKELTAEKDVVSPANLAGLSGLLPEELKPWTDAWPKAGAERRRNVLVALTELAEDNVEMDFTPVFRHALADEDDEVRAAAIAGLWECQDHWFIDALLRLLRHDPSDQVREAAAQALAPFALFAETGKLRKADGDRVAKALLESIDDADETADVRRRSMESLAALSHPRVPDIIQSAYEDEEPKMRASALFAMGRTCDPRWLPTLRTELDNADPEFRFEAAGALGEMGDESAVVDLIARINDPDPEVQGAVVSALGAIGGTLARKALARAAQSADARVAELAAAALQMSNLDDDPLGLPR